MIRLPRVSVVLASAVALLAGAVPALAETVGLWHMNELSGKMVDSSGAGNHGAVQNIKRVSPGYTGSGRAYRFNGSSSRVVIDNEANLNPGARSVRISARVKFSSRPSDAIGDYDLVRKGGGVYKMGDPRVGSGVLRLQRYRRRALAPGRPRPLRRPMAHHRLQEDVDRHHADRRWVIELEERRCRLDLQSRSAHLGGQAQRIGRLVRRHHGRGQDQDRLTRRDLTGLSGEGAARARSTRSTPGTPQPCSAARRRGARPWPSSPGCSRPWPCPYARSADRAAR